MFKKKNASKANPAAVPDFRTETGFKQLYEENAKKLFVICYSRIRNREEAEEIVQDIFKSVWERREAINNRDGSIERYLTRAVKLKTIDYFRKQTREIRHLSDNPEDICGGEHCTENQFNFMELKRRVTYLVDQLPNMCREVYRLSREKGLSNREIASTLLISEKTVESHMTKALSHLRKNLANYSSLGVIEISFFLKVCFLAA